MKKFLCILLSLVMVMCLFTACDEDETVGKKGDKGDEVNDGIVSVDEELTVESLGTIYEAIAEEGSVEMTATIGLTLSMEDSFIDDEMDVEDLFKSFGWTENKMDATLTMSVVTVSDSKGLVELSLSTAAKKDIAKITTIVDGKLVYVSTDFIYDVLNIMADMQGITGDDLKEAKDQVDTMLNGKKYISVDVEAFWEEIMADSSYDDDKYYDDEYIVDDEYYDDSVSAAEPIAYDSSSAPSTEDIEEIAKLGETLLEKIAKEETLIDGIVKAMKDVNMITEGKGSLEVTINKDIIIALVEKIIPFAKENKNAIADLAIDLAIDIVKFTEGEDGLPTDDEKAETRNEIIEAIESLEDEWKDAKADVEDALAEVDFDVKLKFSVDGDKDSLLKNTLAANVSDPANEKNAATLKASLEIKKTTKTVDVPVAGDCMTFEDFMAKISG